MTILLGYVVAFLLVAIPLRTSLRNIAAARADADITRIEAGFTSWTSPTPATPLRAIAWPIRQSPTDMAAADEPVPWTDPDWAVNELLLIVAVNKQYEELIAA